MPPLTGGVANNPATNPTGNALPGVNNANSGGVSQPTSTFYGAQQQQNSGGAGAQTNAGTQLNQYTVGQQQLQASIPQMLQGVLSGGGMIPPYWTAPPEVFRAANEQHQQLAPKFAATYGAGGPQYLASRMQMNRDLAANLYQGGFDRYLNALNSAANIGFGAPVGQQTAQTGMNNWQQQGNQNTVGYQTGSPLGALGLGGAAAGSTLSQLAAIMGLM